MRWNLLVLLFCSLLISFPGCKRRETPKPVPRISGDSNHALTDVCSLITSQEIEAIQGSPIKETKDSERSDTGFRVGGMDDEETKIKKSKALAQKALQRL
jgi:hypothetical protein